MDPTHHATADHHRSPDQAPRRREERLLRKRVIAVSRCATRTGWPRGRIGRFLGIGPRTLERWCRDWEDHALVPTPTGRPRHMSDPPIHQQVLEALEQLGPHTGLPTLQGMFPTVCRRELLALQDQFRDLYDQAHPPSVLHWQFPGAVWACDFTDTVPVDDCYRCLLVVRDLASHYQLLALPAPEATAQVAADALVSLFHRWGHPLVLKHDNGGHFTAPIVRDLLAAAGVTVLLSPVYTPQYNGGVEAGNGAIKVRAHYQAACHGRVTCWSSDDVEAARLQANLSLRPWGRLAPTPQQIWDQRQPIPPVDRRAFQDRVVHLDHSIRVDWENSQGHALDGSQRAALARVAVRRALEQLGYLLVQRSRISPPINT